MTPFLFSPKKKTLGTYWGVLRGQGKDWKKRQKRKHEILEEEEV